MNVLHLNSTDEGGGAARAACRLHRGLRSDGVDSEMLVGLKRSDEPQVHGRNTAIGSLYGKLRRRMDDVPLWRYSDGANQAFSPAWVPERRHEQVDRLDPDVVNLHWLAHGFLRIETLARLDRPVVWTLHDMWAFTGGCHYVGECDRFHDACGSCPALRSSDETDLSRRVWERKQSAFEDVDLTVVTPSHWLGDRAAESSLLSDVPIEVIPNCIDTDQYRPRARSDGISELGLDHDMRYLLFGASYETPRKGGDLLEKSLRQLESDGDLALLAFGNADVESLDVSLPVEHLGYLTEPDLRLAYSTADVTVVPSRQDNLPNIALESLACGTPCVAFEVGGLPDMVRHRETGYLARPFDCGDLAAGIRWVVADDERREVLGVRAREDVVERFSADVVTERYVDLYEDIR